MIFILTDVNFYYFDLNLLLLLSLGLLLFMLFALVSFELILSAIELIKIFLVDLFEEFVRE